MNRRSFISNFTKGILAAGAGFTILPGAGRIWSAVKEPLLLVGQIDSDFTCVMAKPTAAQRLFAEQFFSDNPPQLTKEMIEELGWKTWDKVDSIKTHDPTIILSYSCPK